MADGKCAFPRVQRSLRWWDSLAASCAKGADCPSRVVPDKECQMAAPITVRCAGYFHATRGGVDAGEATLRMKSATQGTLAFGGKTWKLKGSASGKTFHGTVPGSVVDLKIQSRSQLTGTVDGSKLDLSRNVVRPIPAAELAQSDAGPTGAMKATMDATPDYQAAVGDTTTFWYAFGPVLYRGRLDGSARVICIASDPGPAECLPFARRTLVGDSGQKVQGFLAKLGLTRSYVLVNAYAVAMHPGAKTKGLQVLKTNVAIKTARHNLYNALLAGGAVQAVITFGDQASTAYQLWAASNPAGAAVAACHLNHPANVDRKATSNDPHLKTWAKAITKRRTLVTADAGGDPTGPNYGAYFTELDYARIPRWDLLSVAPKYFGDDSWGRAANPQHNNCCQRPSPDDGVSLELTPSPGQGVFLRYKYQSGTLKGAKNKSGKNVSVDAFGIPV